VTRLPTLVVLAKEPRPGRVKTRLSPPCTPAEAASLAAASLADTLIAARDATAGRRVLALDGDPGRWIPRGFEVTRQVGGGLDRRLAAAVDAVRGPVFVIGMDTPQLTGRLLTRSLEALMEPGRDAVLGPALDGGYWAIGLRQPDGRAIAGVPMSVPWTAAAQRARLRDLGLRVGELPELRDVDTYDDARVVAAHAPRTRFGARLRELESEWSGALAGTA
jgi:uncharacterized protein